MILILLLSLTTSSRNKENIFLQLRQVFFGNLPTKTIKNTSIFEN